MHPSREGRRALVCLGAPEAALDFLLRNLFAGGVGWGVSGADRGGRVVQRLSVISKP